MGYRLLKFRLKISKVIVITIIWQVAGVLYAWYMHSFIEAVTSMDNVFNLQRSILYTFLSASFAGLTVGATEVFLLKRLFRRKSFIFTVVWKSLLYFVLLLIMFYLVLMIYAANVRPESYAGDSLVVATYRVFVSTPILYDLIYWVGVMVITFIFLQFSEKFGPGGLSGYIFGKYHRPHKQTRIFMFLDIRDSTSIAERLGHVKYFSFLNDFFSDIADSVLFTKGEIYQYVGDEVVVSWKLDDGLKNANFVRCLFAIKDRIRKKQDIYKNHYGEAPNFKAGFFHGEVTAGEIGAVKKEVVFSGDVLNTGSRIQEKCNYYNVDNLISKGLLKFVNLPTGVSYKRVDSLLLKGKVKDIELYTLFRFQENG